MVYTVLFHSSDDFSRRKILCFLKPSRLQAVTHPPTFRNHNASVALENPANNCDKYSNHEQIATLNTISQNDF